MEVVAKIEERKKKKAEQRRGFNDVTDMAKMNLDYSIDDALLFIEGQLSGKKKGKNFKKGPEVEFVAFSWQITGSLK